MDDLKALGEKIDEAKSRAGLGAPEDMRGADARGSRRATNMATEFVAAAGVGAGIGYVMDRWLGTSPVFFIAWFFLGFATGVWNLMRAGKKNED